MLKVFICEDNRNYMDKLKKIIENAIIIEDLDMELTLATEDPYEVLKYLEDNEVNGLYFLDVDLKSSINGIQLSERIREYDPRGFIIFVTTHAEMSYLTFKYKAEAMDYIIKDNFTEVCYRVRDCILNAHKRYSSLSNTIQNIFILNIGSKVITIEYNKILFFETSDTVHKLRLHAIDRQVEFYSKMKSIEEKLDKRFYRCHQSFIVNKDNIKEIDKTNRIIHMINGETCMASVRGIRGLDFL
ncbi:accessory gene regulator protein A [Gottschalkia acidurici 9a]|uniref:Accessory gene regulator protein A n=1 Tax=Gottschalkia acidurici (strain ATCC 7906 / DSM 604 / BCRC 14475 / CIP 104303 / KCTC 5404 / NCIMB 10678 / 9a) TaxID=1128398 RepID=K0AVI7_GOTA9|nr:LytTR family DNA-binding domain-containing protein [Gottschalkia acidurici]AFS77858.1 accessory gene regulator protein A [Gottschalkia acidurici 9a]